MFDIQAIVDAYGKNASTPYNPRPLYAYIRHIWLATTREAEIHHYLMNDDLKLPFSKITSFLQLDLNALLGKNPHLQIELVLGNCRLLLSLLANKIVAEVQQQIIKTQQILLSFIELLNVLDKHLAQAKQPVVFQDQFEHALILPGGYCFAISTAYKQQITPDPLSSRSSQHLVQCCDDMYYFGVNTTTKPSAEVLGQSLVAQMDPDCRGLYPSKSPCTLLSRTSNGGFTTQLLHLSLKVKGVTLESLILARDAFRVLSPDSQHEIPRAIIGELRTLSRGTEKEPELSKEELLRHVPERYHGVWEEVFTKLLIQKYKAQEIYIALKILSIVGKKPEETQLKEWFCTAIPHLNGLMDLLRQYGSNRTNRQFRAFIEDSIGNLDPHQVHLLGLSCSMLLDHDAVGTNFIVDLDAMPHRLCYIDADYRLIHPAITCKQSTSSMSATSLSPKTRHYAQTNTILTVFEAFHCAPLSTGFKARMNATSPEEVFFKVFNDAREYERIYTSFLMIFPPSELESSQLHIPLLLSADLVLQVYRIFQAVFAAFANDNCRMATGVLRQALPNTARISTHAYQADIMLSGWRSDYFAHCPNLEELFEGDDPVIDCVHEVGCDSSKRSDFYCFPYLLKKFLLEWMDYKQIKDEAHARLCQSVQVTLVTDGIMIEKEFSSLQQKRPRVLIGCSPARTDEPNSPADSPTPTPRNETPRSSARLSMFRKATKLGSSGELPNPRPYDLTRSTSQTTLSSFWSMSAKLKDSSLPPDPNLEP